MKSNLGLQRSVLDPQRAGHCDPRADVITGVGSVMSMSVAVDPGWSGLSEQSFGLARQAGLSGTHRCALSTVTPRSPQPHLPRDADRGILAQMRTTLNLDDDLLERASELSGVKEKTALVRLGLEALIALESARRLAALGGSEKKLQPVPRRRTGTA